MKQEYQLLYQDMLADIERCMEIELPEKERAENCFWIAANYWNRLKEFIKGTSFMNESEEINFFRNVKPQFTCHIEYYIIVSEVLSFVPSDKVAAIKSGMKNVFASNDFIERTEILSGIFKKESSMIMIPIS